MNQKVLLIEDNKDIRDLIELVLKMDVGWEVQTISNGIEGIEIAKLERPDVILLDYVMPKMDGITACNHLRDNPLTCNIPIIFITARVDFKSLDRLENTHAVGIIIKPFDINTLASRIQEMCGWSKNQNNTFQLSLSAYQY